MICRVDLIKFYEVRSTVEAFLSINKYQFIGYALTKIMWLKNEIYRYAEEAIPQSFCFSNTRFHYNDNN